jgi:hypothetical protein
MIIAVNKDYFSTEHEVTILCRHRILSVTMTVNVYMEFKQMTVFVELKWQMYGNVEMISLVKDALQWRSILDKV